MEFIKRAREVGNSAGVLLPKSLLGSEVKITVLKRPMNIKKQVLEILEPFFSELRGVYVLNETPVEVLAVSSKLRRIINKNNLKVSIVPLTMIKKDIKIKPALRRKLMRARTIFNRALLIDLKREIKGGRL